MTKLTEAQGQLAEELSSLVIASEKLMDMVGKLEKSTIIDKSFSKEMASLAIQMLAHSRQAANVALP